VRTASTSNGISLTKIGDDVSGAGSHRVPFEEVDDRYAVFVGRCTQSGAPYLVKYERHMNRIDAQDPRLAELFKTREYLLKAAVPVQQDYFELSDGSASDGSVSSTQMIGQPDCPHCQARFGMAVCGCGGIHCVGSDGSSTCPWCGKTGTYSMSDGTDGGGDIGRGRGCGRGKQTGPVACAGRQVSRRSFPHPRRCGDRMAYTRGGGRCRLGGTEPGGQPDRLRLRDAGAAAAAGGQGRPYPSGLTGVDLFCCPAPRHEVVQTVYFVVCDAGEDPAQPGFRIDLVHAAGFDERVGDGSGIAAAF